MLKRHAPYLPVADVGATVAYYRDVLGFQAEYSAGDPAVFAICSRDGLAVMFRGVDRPEGIRPNEGQGGTWDVFFWVDDADRLHGDLLARGATIVYGPILQESYGMREFAIRDPDGHVLGFGSNA